MPVLVYDGKEYEIDENTAAWLRRVAEAFKHRLKTLERVLESLRSRLVEVSIDGDKLLVPRPLLQAVIARTEERSRRRRPPIELPIRRPPEALVEKPREHVIQPRHRKRHVLLARG